MIKVHFLVEFAPQADGIEDHIGLHHLGKGLLKGQEGARGQAAGRFVAGDAEHTVDIG